MLTCIKGVGCDNILPRAACAYHPAYHLITAPPPRYHQRHIVTTVSI